MKKDFWIKQDDINYILASLLFIWHCEYLLTLTENTALINYSHPSGNFALSCYQYQFRWTFFGIYIRTISLH